MVKKISNIIMTVICIFSAILFIIVITIIALFGIIIGNINQFYQYMFTNKLRRSLTKTTI
jgi:5-bromo-4-chloroindolyl phosphate hydrolysis protein